MSMTLSHPLDKIVSAIQRKGTMTLTGIKRSIAEFNQSGGVEKLRLCLADLIANGVLVLRQDKGDKGQPIETYCLVNSKTGSTSNSNGNGGSTNLTITVSLDIEHKGLLDAVHSFLSVDDRNSSEDGSTVAAEDDGCLPPDIAEETLSSQELSGLELARRFMQNEEGDDEEEDQDDDNSVPF